MVGNDNNKLHASSTCTTSALKLQRKLFKFKGRWTALLRRYLWDCVVPRMFLLYSGSNLQISRITETKDWQCFWRGCALSYNTDDQVCIVIVQFWTLGINLTCSVFARLMWRNRTGKVLEAALNGVDWGWLYLIKVTKQRITRWACSLTLTNESNNLAWCREDHSFIHQVVKITRATLID